jgi:TRAP-type C4-dicarboxylate transport system permease large subunit
VTGASHHQQRKQRIACDRSDIGSGARAGCFGVDSVHFGMVMIVNLALGMITPPFGVNLFAACTVARISLDRIISSLLPFVTVILACLTLIIYFPLLSLYLRDLVFVR